MIGEHGDRNEFVDMFEKWLFGRLPTPPDCRRHPTVLRAQLHELCDHDLMCWCPPDEPCHADLLLKLANQIL